ncbi:MAG: hypothetical protein OXI53_00620 [Nitrospira sp.]|nr:hypothetical protein [Nitrospira sp.]MDE0403804.1 hypothetical protein [Nitrospira sp.]
MPHSSTTTDYEAPSTLDARAILPSDVRKGPHHTVLDEVVPFRHTHRYRITSPYGQFEAYGGEMLKIRIQEIQTIATMDEEVNHIQSVAAGAKHAILSPFKFMLGLVNEPKKTLLAIPKGMWHMATRIGEMAVGKRGSLEDPENAELLGFSTVKRQVANHFGVDVYSSNRILQEKLNSLSWAGYAGDAAVRLATLPIGGPAGAVLTGTSFSTTVGELLRDHTPEELRHLNRDKLEIMGLDDSLIETFLQHPWYSPRHETVLVQALFEMNIVKNRKTFFKVATSARFEEEALFFQRIAEMLLSYHQNVKPLEEFVAIDDRLLMGLTRDHTLIGMLPVEFLPWRSELAESAETVATWTSSKGLKKVELWMTGKPTPRAHRELLAKGITVRGAAMDYLAFHRLANASDLSDPLPQSLP